MNKKNEFSGQPITTGVAIGPAKIIISGQYPVPKYHIDAKNIPEEIGRFDQAIQTAKQQIIDIENKAEISIQSEARDLLKAHIQLIEDPMLYKDTIRELKRLKINVEYALEQTLEKIIKKFMQMEDSYIRERVHDIKDIKQRLLSAFILKKNENQDITSPAVIIADDLLPSQTVKIKKNNILGIISEQGGATSHTSIFARSHGIPALINTDKIIDFISDGDIVILDAIKGKLFVNPDPSLIKTYESIQHFLTQQEKLAAREAPSEVSTRDHRRIEVSANIDSADDLEFIISKGAEGIGLLRTEYLFEMKKLYRDEEKQFLEYRSIAQAMKDKPVIIRTVDVGGDKIFSDFNHAPEANPFLGLRAIRFSLKYTKEFKIQIRAILRAAAWGNIKILLPMISGEEELNRALRCIQTAKNELAEEQKKTGCAETGIMIEVPSAALISSLLIKKVDFFSVGTNDLVQYTMAADRTNQQVAYLHDPLHPAVIMLIKRAIDACRGNSKKIFLCGEIGSDPFYIPLLIGMGIDGFSMTGSSIPLAKNIIRNLDFFQARKLAGSIFASQDAKRSRQHALDFMKKYFPAWYREHIESAKKTK
ncbi:MAG: phosphoenolpyruvate--protein phosphotransferase [Spirochaetes bacterium GWF1_41_5]|nr:MAG: phosphoenolpyruvate--protein phosphotransferase [Spirochaetes bacterium GWF1_41_5]HBE04000.1 phosphoenolpyruvate--protein phosphotransferase [Spirochaetia bacterium]